MDKTTLINRLFEIGAVKFGEFKLKSGGISPIYVDLRVTISYPEVLKMVAEAMWEQIKNLNFDLICGVPYTALPIATAISLEHNKPMIMRRKEVKDYGTRKAIEGAFKPGQTVLVVEDLVTSGSSVFETVEPLNFEKLKVSDIMALLDREQGAKKHLADKNLALHAILTMTELLNTLEKENKISLDLARETRAYIIANQV